MPLKKFATTTAALSGAAFLAACAVTAPQALTPDTTVGSGATLAATTSALPSAPPCNAAELQLARAGNEAAMGHRAFAFRYTNISQTTCALNGYAKVVALDASGATSTAIPVVHATGGYLVASTGQAAHAMSPGHSLWFVLTWSVIPRGTAPCAGMAALRIALPGARRAPSTPAAGGAAAAPATHQTPSATTAPTVGQTFEQVSSVCNGIHVLPFRTRPTHS
ncbi:MAG TPA: DUF4232 domain-containing protein [Nevskiaceae bacterium]|nr:DUF4232 domain-containing protein [Nevskiaceae bacterium]